MSNLNVKPGLKIWAHKDNRLPNNLETLISELRQATIDIGGNGLDDWIIYTADRYTSGVAADLGSYINADLSENGTVNTGQDSTGRRYWNLTGNNSNYLLSSSQTLSVHSNFSSLIFCSSNTISPSTGLYGFTISATSGMGAAGNINGYLYGTYIDSNDYEPWSRTATGSGLRINNTTPTTDHQIQSLTTNGQMEVYINGSSIGTLQTTGNPSGTSRVLLGNRFSSPPNVDNRAWNGRIYFVAYCVRDLDSGASGGYATARERCEAALKRYYFFSY